MYHQRVRRVSMKTSSCASVAAMRPDWKLLSKKSNHVRRRKAALSIELTTVAALCEEESHPLCTARTTGGSSSIHKLDQVSCHGGNMPGLDWSLVYIPNNGVKCVTVATFGMWGVLHGRVGATGTSDLGRMGSGSLSPSCSRIDTRLAGGSARGKLCG